jgi:hypothetical protein
MVELFAVVISDYRRICHHAVGTVASSRTPHAGRGNASRGSLSFRLNPLDSRPLWWIFTTSINTALPIKEEFFSVARVRCYQ